MQSLAPESQPSRRRDSRNEPLRKARLRVPPIPTQRCTLTRHYPSRSPSHLTRGGPRLFALWYGRSSVSRIPPTRNPIGQTAMREIHLQVLLIMRWFLIAELNLFMRQERATSTPVSAAPSTPRLRPALKCSWLPCSCCPRSR